MKRLLSSVLFLASPSLAFAFSSSSTEALMSIRTPMGATKVGEEIVLHNDSFNDNGGQAYIQQGFVEGEKAGIWVQVPTSISKFKIDSFRVLMGSVMMTPMQPELFNTQIFFTMGIANAPSPSMPAEIENAAQVTPGPYWNDIPAQGASGALGCATGGQYIGAALEFTHSGLPSIYRDLDGLSDVRKNTLMAIPGGWQYSVSYGLRGDWVMRIVGHAAKAGECP